MIWEYLQELGGDAVTETEVQGPDWHASLEQVEDHQVGSLRIGQVYLVVEADPQVMENLRTGLDKKLLRAGG